MVILKSGNPLKTLNAARSFSIVFRTTGQWSQIFKLIVSTSEKVANNINVVVRRQLKRKTVYFHFPSVAPEGRVLEPATGHVSAMRDT